MNETQTAAVHPLEEMGISREVVQAFDWMGFQNLTAIQQKCIPLMMDGHDIIAIAPTGTGKTLGFGIPMLEYVNLDDSNIQEVVLAPTRELAQQIADELTVSSRKIFDIIDKPVTLFRPPFGDYNNTLLSVADEQGLISVQWSVDSLDWKGLSATQIAERVQKAKRGDIILCHNNSDHIVEALPLILEAMKLKGLSVVPVGELIYHSNYYIDATGKQIAKPTAE